MLILSLLMVVFALQNSMIIKMKFWFWDAETYLGLVLIIFFVAGGILGIASSLPAIIDKNKQIRDLMKKLSSGKDSGDQVQDNISGDPEFEDINENLNK